MRNASEAAQSREVRVKSGEGGKKRAREQETKTQGKIRRRRTQHKDRSLSFPGECVYCTLGMRLADLCAADNLHTDGGIAKAEFFSHAALQLVCNVCHIGAFVALLDLTQMYEREKGALCKGHVRARW